MIEVTSEGIKLGCTVVRALLAFSATDDGEDGKQPYMNGIGIDLEGVCSTDGHTGLRFLVKEDEGHLWLGVHHEKWFSRELVEERLLRAKGQQPFVELGWHEVSRAGAFPPLSSVEPERVEVREGGGVLLDTLYLERLVAVGRACRRPREQGEAQLPRIPGALIVAFKGEMDPVRFEVGTQDERCAHVAYVTIMPVRQGVASKAVAGAAAATAGAKTRKKAARKSRGK